MATFDENGKVYWDSLTPMEKFEIDIIGIDPIAVATRRHKVSSSSPHILCTTHFELNCKICWPNGYENRHQRKAKSKNSI